MSISDQVEIIYTTLTIPRKPSCVLIDHELSVAWAVGLIAKKLAVPEDDIEFYTVGLYAYFTTPFSISLFSRLTKNGLT